VRAVQAAAMVESQLTSRRTAKAEVVEKLEKILQAEDDAHAALADARDAARVIVEEARARASEIRVAVAQEARISAEAAREALLERAQAEAAEVATRATHEARAALVAAEARLSGAVERALRQLVG